MKFRELAEKVKSGEVPVVLCGHRLGDAKGRLLERYERSAAMAAGANDGKWPLEPTENAGAMDARMREHFAGRLDSEVGEDGRLYDLEGDDCRDCGDNLRWVLSDGVLMPRLYWDLAASDFLIRPLEYVCPYAKRRATGGEIRVTTRLVFANFFREVEDGPTAVRFTNEWSLCNDRGIENITRFKSERGVAFGQMGNMSVGIFLHPDKRSVIVGDPYKTTRKKSVINGHTLVGRICLDVWRWEAADRTLVADWKKFSEENAARGFVELAVEPGVWRFDHYYHSGTSRNKAVYSKLTLTY